MLIVGQEPSLAVLIDADNTSPRHAYAIFDEIAKLGVANVRRIYGDFSTDRLKGWNDVMQPLAILPVQQFNYTTGKNAADITLVIDAMDLMHRDGPDGFCLVSSDSDFTRLAQRLRQGGKIVYGIGKHKAPEAFREACSRFIDVDNLPGSTAETKQKAGTPDSPKTEPATRAVPFIRKAMKQAWAKQEWVDLAVIGERLKQLAPDFDPRTYGCSNLVAVVENAANFLVERPAGRGVRIKRR